MKKSIYSSLIAVLMLCFWQNSASAQEDNTVYSFVSMETAPKYPGGIENFYKFLGENIKYPKQAKDENIQGNVFLSFTVEKDGVINDVKVDRKLGGGTDEEALRVVRLSEKWIPGMINGQAVRVKYNIPVKFKIPGVASKPKTPMPIVIPGVENVGENTIYSFVSMDNQPKYPGGISKFYDFLKENIKYPNAAKENKIEGNVFVSFVVEKDGSLNDMKVDRKLGYGTDEEALRVLKLSRAWNPGTINGTAVRVKYNVPVNFSLNPKASKIN